MEAALMKKWLGYLLIFAMLLGVSACAEENTFVRDAEMETEEELQAVDVQFEQIYDYEKSEEKAEITAADPEGNVLWRYESESYPLAQCDAVSEIGLYEDHYYFCEAGTILAADSRTGEILWKNDEFGGCPLDSSFAFGEDGTLYICGYLGPELFAVSETGETLGNLQQYKEGTYGPYKLELSGEDMAVLTYEQGPDGEGDYVVQINLTDWLEEEKENRQMKYTAITMDEAKEIFSSDGDYLILDVRRADEFAAGHIPGAINIANEEIADTEPADLPDKEQTIYVYCRSGVRSAQAAEKLAAMGYSHIVDIGGILDWTGEIQSDDAAPH